ncbi:F-box/kelch-repeat protein [Spatholobus suberectus]|nr:F-box/kelch-repeat protein [Spatholobus suberectus]
MASTESHFAIEVRLQVLEFPLLRSCFGETALSKITMQRHSHPMLMIVTVRFWNPATSLRSKNSPCIEMGFGDVKTGFGYDDSTNTYKVAAVMEREMGSGMETKSFLVGERLQVGLYFPRILQDKRQFVSGTLNWLVECDTAYQYVIFSFDMKKETYRYLSLPADDVDVRFRDQDIGVLRGCLCHSHSYKETCLTNEGVWSSKVLNSVDED